MAMNYFSINSVPCTEYGIICKQMPPVILAAPRVTYQTLPGRDGALTILERDEEDGPVYDDISVTAVCYMRDLSQLNEAAAFLERSGEISFPTRPGGHYVGRVSGQIPIEQIMRGRTQREFEVTFRLGPFWYAEGISDISLTAPAAVTNPGNAHAEPLIAVVCRGDGVLTVNGSVIYINAFTGEINLDCAAKLAYSGDALKNSAIDVEENWPRLNPGTNLISWSGAISSIRITPRWRYR